MLKLIKPVKKNYNGRIIKNCDKLKNVDLKHIT